VKIFNLTWFDVDLSRGLIHVRVSKNGKDRFVPINQTVRAMLEGLLRISEYVFPSPKTEGRLVDVKFRFDKAKREAGIRDFRFMTCATPPLLAWQRAELMLLR
jgi:integrase